MTRSSPSRAAWPTTTAAGASTSSGSSRSPPVPRMWSTLATRNPTSTRGRSTVASSSRTRPTVVSHCKEAQGIEVSVIDHQKLAGSNVTPIRLRISLQDSNITSGIRNRPNLRRTSKQTKHEDPHVSHYHTERYCARESRPSTKYGSRSPDCQAQPSEYHPCSVLRRSNPPSRGLSRAARHPKRKISAIAIGPKRMDRVRSKIRPWQKPDHRLRIVDAREL